MKKRVNKRNKKGVSLVVVSVLLVLVVLVIAGIIFLSSRAFQERIQKQSAENIARMECPKEYNFNLYGCFNKSGNSIYIEISNLKNDIPSGSLISLESGPEKVLIPLPEPPFEGVKQGEGFSDTIIISEYVVDLDSFGLEKVKLIPVFIYKDVRVLCEDTPEIKIEPCQ